MKTPAADVVVAAFAVLAADEQEEAFVKINDARLRRLAAADSEIATYIRSLVRVADRVGELSPDSYRAGRKELLVEGQEVHEINAVIRFFGSWRRAKEALSLSEVTTATKIEARFRARLIGKPHTYSEQTMSEVLHRCAAELGGPPLVIEYEHWRARELELAKARDEELFLPSSSPFRRRWSTWEQALLALGFPEKDVRARLEPSRGRDGQNLRWFRFRVPESND
jgi:hypothetical protein